MRLYHGSNQDFESIDLAKGMRHKDFGKGFYLTPNRATALRMAQKKARLFGGVPTLISYELDESVLYSDLKVKVFPEKACEEWLRFVDANRDRNNRTPVHDYDIVVGPIADDGVVLQLTRWREGIITPGEAARLLQDRHLDQQWYFGTERAVSRLRKTGSEPA